MEGPWTYWDCLVYNLYLWLACHVLHFLTAVYLNPLNTLVRTFAAATKGPLPVSDYIKQVTAGCMFSDGHIRNPNERLRSTGNHRMEFTFKSASLAFTR